MKYVIKNSSNAESEKPVEVSLRVDSDGDVQFTAEGETIAYLTVDGNLCVSSFTCSPAPLDNTYIVNILKDRK